MIDDAGRERVERQRTIPRVRRVDPRHDDRIVDRSGNEHAEVRHARDRLVAHEAEGSAQRSQVAGSGDANAQLLTTRQAAGQIVNAALDAQRDSGERGGGAAHVKNVVDHVQPRAHRVDRSGQRLQRDAAALHVEAQADVVLRRDVGNDVERVDLGVEVSCRAAKDAYCGRVGEIVRQRAQRERRGHARGGSA